MPQLKNFRRRLFLALDSVPGSRQHDQWVGVVIMVTIFASVIALILDTVARINAEYGHILHGIEQFAVLLFTAEYLARIWVAPEHKDPKYHHPIKGRLRWMLSPMALVDLMAILPATTWVTIGGDLLFLRLLRVARLLKITRYSRALTTLGVVIYSERRSWLAAMGVMMMMLIFSSTIMWLIERDAQPDVFSSIPATMWWGVITLTTVGYGDVTPITPLGRIFGGLCAVVGIGMFTLPAAILAEGFTRELKRRDFIVSFSMVSRVPMFKGLKAELLADIAGHLAPQLLPARYTIIHTAEVPEALYFIVSGKVEVEYAGMSLSLHEGDFFGQEAILTEMGEEVESPVHISTLTECRLMKLSREDFDWLMRHHPHALEAIKQADKGRGYHSKIKPD